MTVRWRKHAAPGIGCLLAAASMLAAANVLAAPAPPCEACHGAHGEGMAAVQAPRIAGQTADYLQKQLMELSKKHDIISNVRGKGLLTAFDFPDKLTRDKFIKLGMDNNAMFLGCGHHTIRFRPTLIIDKNHINEGLNIMEIILNVL